KRVETRPLAGLSRLDLVCKMLGKKPEELRAGATAFAERRTGEGGAPLLSARGLARGRRLAGVDVDVKAGEIVGVAGLLGSGRTETARAIFGLDPLDAGTIELDGKPLEVRSPRDAIASGIALL